MGFSFPVKLPVVCNNFEECQELVNRYGERVVTGEQKSTGNNGIGPRRLWAQARFYAAQNDTPKNTARSKVAKMKRNNERDYLNFKEKYSRFVKSYARRKKVSFEAAEEALAELFDNNPEEYKLLIKKKSA